MSSQPDERKSPYPLKYYTIIPNSVIEYQNAFPPAELRFLLMVLKWPGVPIPDDLWKQWTGLDKRMKDMAIKGLKEKGLCAEGKGDKMTFSFDVTRWEQWYPNWDRGARARTKGRQKSVTAKPGMRVHPACLESGCKELCKTEVIPFPSTNLEKPVSRIDDNELFKQLLGTFLSMGVELCEADIAKCEKIWRRLNSEEQPTAAAYAAARAGEEWARIESRYIPRPWNYLGEKHWTRRTPVAPRKPKTKGQQAFEAAAKRFMEQE